MGQEQSREGRAAPAASSPRKPKGPVPPASCQPKVSDAVALLWLAAEVTGSPELGLFALVLAWLEGLNGILLAEANQALATPASREALARGTVLSLSQRPEIQRSFPTVTLRCSGYNDRDERCGRKQSAPQGARRVWCCYHGNSWD
jgi:hypothetical protein